MQSLLCWEMFVNLVGEKADFNNCLVSDDSLNECSQSCPCSHCYIVPDITVLMSVVSRVPAVIVTLSLTSQS